MKTAWPWGGVNPGCTGGFPGGGVYVTEPTGRLQVLKGEAQGGLRRLGKWLLVALGVSVGKPQEVSEPRGWKWSLCLGLRPLGDGQVVTGFRITVSLGN